jgi:hypothetical protein
MTTIRMGKIKAGPGVESLGCLRHLCAAARPARGRVFMSGWVGSAAAVMRPESFNIACEDSGSEVQGLRNLGDLWAEPDLEIY